MKAKLLLVTASLLLGAIVFLPERAQAGGGFSVGFGTHSCFGAGCYRPYPYYGFSHRYYRPRPWGYGYYRPYYPPPRVIYRPAPPVVIEQAPPPQAYASQPAPAYDTSYCREYTRNASIDGETVEIYGTACMQPDGSWRIVN